MNLYYGQLSKQTMLYTPRISAVRYAITIAPSKFPRAPTDKVVKQCDTVILICVIRDLSYVTLICKVK